MRGALTMGCVWTAFGLLRTEMGSCCEHDTEPLGSRKGGEFLDQLSDC
jgi:hypothetical protein